MPCATIPESYGPVLHGLWHPSGRDRARPVGRVPASHALPRVWAPSGDSAIPRSVTRLRTLPRLWSRTDVPHCPEGERKTITVLFAEITDSLALIRSPTPKPPSSFWIPPLQAMMDAAPVRRDREPGAGRRYHGPLWRPPLAQEGHDPPCLLRRPGHADGATGLCRAVRRTRPGLPALHRPALREVVVRAIHNDLHTDYSAVGTDDASSGASEAGGAPSTILRSPPRLGGWWKVWCGSRPLGPIAVRARQSPEVCELLGTSGQRRRAVRRPPPVASRPLSGGRRNWPSSPGTGPGRRARQVVAVGRGRG